MEPEKLIESLKSNNKKIRYKALDNILKLSRSNNSKQKQMFLNLVLLKSKQKDWEERYVAIYAISRFYKRDWKFEDFKQQFFNVITLLEDNDGRVRIAAQNALEHFRMNFLNFALGQWQTNWEALIDMWCHALFSLWDKINKLDDGKMQKHLLECIKILFHCNLEGFLNNKKYKKCISIWYKVCELDNLYYHF